MTGYEKSPDYGSPPPSGAGVIVGALFAIGIIVVAAFAFARPSEAQGSGRVDWSDADSGKIDGQKFRLANVDAPESRSPKQVNGAKCVEEQALGKVAAAWIMDLTKGKSVTITKKYDAWTEGRQVMDLALDGVSIRDIGIAAGHMRPWPFKDGKTPLADKPDWCNR